MADFSFAGRLFYLNTVGCVVKIYASALSYVVFDAKLKLRKLHSWLRVHIALLR